MIEIEQLRKEVNELRERLAQLEDRVNTIGPGIFQQPTFIWPNQKPPDTGNPLQPPYVVTC